MNVQKIDNLSFKSSVLKPSNLKKTLGVAGLGATALFANRADLQKNSNLQPLKFEDNDWDLHYPDISDADFYDRYYGPHGKENRAREVVKASQFVNGFAAFSLAQLTTADGLAFLALYTAMATKVATIYDVKLNKAVVDALGTGARAAFINSLAAKAVGKIPIVGNIVNTVVNVGLTRSMGNNLVDKFEEAEKRYQQNLERRRKLEQIINENEELKRRNDEINKILKELAEEEKKKNGGK